MDSNDVTALVKGRLAILADVDSAAVGEDVPFDALGVDSLMLLELVAVVERAVGMELPEQDLPGLRCLADVRRYVDAMSGAAVAAPGA
jgi:acyl carrier protein